MSVGTSERNFLHQSYIVKNSTESRKACIAASLVFIGGGDQDRTDDLLIANQTLSQLSYTPNGDGMLNRNPGFGKCQAGRAIKAA
jgi:hypothetical protein